MTNESSKYGEWEDVPQAASPVQQNTSAQKSETTPVDAWKPNQQKILESVNAPPLKPQPEKTEDQSITDRISNAYSALPKIVQYGGLATATGLVAKTAYDLYKSNQSDGINPEKPSFIAGLKARFFSPNTTNTPIDYSVQPASGVLAEEAARTQAEKDWFAKLTPTDQALYIRAQDTAAAKNAPVSNEPHVSSEAPISTEAKTPEQIRLAKQIAATQELNQKLSAPVVNVSPINETKPNIAEVAPKLDPKIPALFQPSATAASPVAPVEPPIAAAAPVAAPVLPPEAAPVAAAPVEPVAAMPLETTSAPAEVAPEAPKNTNEKILETINKVAPKAEAAPVESTLGKPDLTTGSGMPAYQGKGEEGGKLKHKKGVFESLNQIPKEYVFVPNGQNMDTVRNAVGQTEYTKNLKSSGGYPTSQQAAHEQSKSINQSLGRVSNAEAKAAGTFVEPTPSITQKIAGVKTVKVAGMTGALILATDLASAATTGESPLANMAQGFKEAVKNKDYGMAAAQASELLNFHPYTMLANQLFGNSPEELKILRQADQARKAGAGRGVAPPSTYQR